MKLPESEPKCFASSHLTWGITFMRRRKSCKPRLATSTPSMSSVPLTPSSVRSRQLTKASVSALSLLSTATCAWESKAATSSSIYCTSCVKSVRSITKMLGSMGRNLNRKRAHRFKYYRLSKLNLIRQSFSIVCLLWHVHKPDINNTF